VRDAFHGSTDPLDISEDLVGPGSKNRKPGASDSRFLRGVTTSISGGAEKDMNVDSFPGIMVQTSMTTDVGGDSRQGGAEDNTKVGMPATPLARPPPAYDAV